VTPAQELAAAADKLDALASKATEGPWRDMSMGSEGSTIHAGGNTVSTARRVGRCGEYADAAYIAAMDPLVGKALAAVLREASYTIENNVNVLVPRGLPAVPVSGGLLDLARMVNGSAS
jgi:hypothetical protein